MSSVVTGDHLLVVLIVVWGLMGVGQLMFGAERVRDDLDTGSLRSPRVLAVWLTTWPIGIYRRAVVRRRNGG